MLAITKGSPPPQFRQESLSQPTPSNRETAEGIAGHHEREGLDELFVKEINDALAAEPQEAFVIILLIHLLIQGHEIGFQNCSKRLLRNH
jgi:hypothetical protein